MQPQFSLVYASFFSSIVAMINYSDLTPFVAQGKLLPEVAAAQRIASKQASKQASSTQRLRSYSFLTRNDKRSDAVQQPRARGFKFIR